MRNILLTSLLLTCIGAGGVPLESPALVAERQKLVNQLHHLRDLRKTIDKIVPVGKGDYDPEYLAILEDYDRRKEAFKLSHRDLQWHIVAKVMRNIDDVDDRLGLITTVRSNPLWRPLQPTIAITSINLANWNKARAMFFKHLRGR